MEELEHKEIISQHNSSDNSGQGASPKNRLHSYNHTSRKTGSDGRDSQCEVREESLSSNLENKDDTVLKNNYQSSNQKSSNTNQNGDYINGRGRGQRYFHNSYRSRGGRGQVNYHNNYRNRGGRGQVNYPNRNSRGRGQESYHNGNERDENGISSSQRTGYDNNQRNDFSGGSRANYNNEQKDVYYNSQRYNRGGANRGHMDNGDGKYVEKNYSQRGGNVGRRGGNSRQQKFDRENRTYGSQQQHYQKYSDKHLHSVVEELLSNITEPSQIKSHHHNSNINSDDRKYKNSKDAGGDYSSPQFHQSCEATSNGDDDSAEAYNSQNHNSNVNSDNINYKHSKGARGGYSSPQFHQSREATYVGDDDSAEAHNSQNHNSNVNNDNIKYKNPKGARGGYSSPRFHRSRKATSNGGDDSAEAHNSQNRNSKIYSDSMRYKKTKGAGGGNSGHASSSDDDDDGAEERTECDMDLIEQFQQSMVLQGYFTTEKVDATDVKQVLNKNRSESKRNIPNMGDITNVKQITEISLQKNITQQVKDIVGGRILGSFPIDLNQNNICNLKCYPHKVSWKADGIRFKMLILGAQKIYLIGADFKNIFHIPKLEFRNKDDLKKHITDTLLDGELVIDINPNTSAKVTRFLIFDAIRVDGKQVASKNFHRRHKIIETDLINPRNLAITIGLLNTKQEPFIVQQKLFWNVSRQVVEELLSSQFLDQVGHGTDGLIFQRNKGPYVSGPTVSVLKYQHDAHRSIDFELKIINQEGERKGELYVENNKEPYGNIEITKEIENLNGKIIECSYKETGWQFLRQRTDRTKPNTYDTAVDIWETICDPVDENYLLNYL